MKCRDVIDKLSAAIDGLAPQGDQQGLRNGFDRSPEYSLRMHQMRTLRKELRSMGAREAPPELTTRLRVIASREAARNRRRADLHATARYWRDRASVWLDNLMRPVALPAAGGLASAVFLFTMLVPMYGDRVSISNDVPTMLSTEAAVKHSSISFGLVENDVVVDVYVDGRGRMIDYSAPLGQVWQYDPDLRRCIENTLLCTQFTPATSFGQPRSDIIRITVRGNTVEVKG